jgi:hypothetical protein
VLLAKPSLEWEGLHSPRFARMMAAARWERITKGDTITMNSKPKLALGVLTALAMLALTFALPRGGALRDAQLAQFPLTVGVWAIFVLLFVKLK